MGRCGSEAKREIPGEHLQLRLGVQTTQMQNVPQSHLARNLAHKVRHLHWTQSKEAGKQVKKSVIWVFTSSQPVYKVNWKTSKKVSNLGFYSQSASIQGKLENK